MKRVIGIFGIALLGVCFGLAQDTQQAPAAQPPAAQAPAVQTPAAPSEPLPTVEQVLNKYIEALGGRAAIEKVTSRVSKGSFEIPAFGANGTLTLYTKAPNKEALVMDVPSFGNVLTGCDGNIAWSNNPMSGLTESSGAALAAAKRDARFNRELYLKELYKTVEVKGKTKVGDQDAYVVQATPEEGTPDTFYFDTTTGLLVRADAERENPQGTQSVESYLKDYREVDGVKVPFTMEQVMPSMTITIKLDDVKNNVEIDDAKFVKPAAAQ